MQLQKQFLNFITAFLSVCSIATAISAGEKVGSDTSDEGPQLPAALEEMVQDALANQVPITDIAKAKSVFREFEKQVNDKLQIVSDRLSKAEEFRQTVQSTGVNPGSFTDGVTKPDLSQTDSLVTSLRAEQAQLSALKRNLEKNPFFLLDTRIAFEQERLDGLKFALRTISPNDVQFTIQNGWIAYYSDRLFKLKRLHAEFEKPKPRPTFEDLFGRVHPSNKESGTAANSAIRSSSGHPLQTVCLYNDPEC